MAVLRGMSLLAVTLALIAGWGCASPCPAQPRCPDAPDAARPRRALMPSLPKIEQCADTGPKDAAQDIEIVGDMGVLRLGADAFVDLDAEQRIVAYFLTLAAAATEPMLYARRNPQGLRVKELAEQLALHGEALPPALRAKVESFARQVFVHRGIHHARTGRKLSLSLTASELEQAALAALAHGATFSEAKDEAKLRAALAKLRPVLFDESVEPMAPVVSIGKPSAAMVAPVIAALEQAAAHARPEQKALLSLQIRALRTHAPGDGAAFGRAWATSRLPVEFFLDLDSEIEASVLMLDASRTSTLQKAMDEAGALFGKAPGGASPVVVYDAAPLWLGPASTRAEASAGGLPIAAGGPAKIVVHGAAMDATSDFVGRIVARGFLADDDADARRCMRPARTAYALLVGQAGKAVPALGEHGPVVGALAGQLAALSRANDERLRDAGLVPDARCGRMIAELYAAEHLLSLRVAKPGEVLRDPEERARAMLLRFALDRGALREVSREGNTVLRIADDASWGMALADLSARVGELVRRGDRAGAKALVDKLGAPPDAQWCSSAAERAKTLGMPDTLVLLTPRLKALRGDDGRILDATLVESLSLIETALIDAGKMEAP